MKDKQNKKLKGIDIMMIFDNFDYEELMEAWEAFHAEAEEES